MRKAKKAVRKAAEAREKAKKAKIARKARQPAIIIPSPSEVKKFASVQPHGENAKDAARLPPPRLFKYAPPDWTRIWAMLADGLVYFAGPLAFNDPYDSRVFPAKTWGEMRRNFSRSNRSIEKRRKAGEDVRWLRTQEEREKIQSKHLVNFPESAKEQADFMARMGNPGICCLSEICDSLPLWAHYARDHKGVCFVFDLSKYVKWTPPDSGRGCFPFSDVRKIEYKGRMLGRKEVLEDADAFRHFFCKSEEWAYEKEWRALIFDAHAPMQRTGETLAASNPFFQEFRGARSYFHNGTLLGVILGCRMHDPLKREIMRIAAARNLAVWQAETRVGKYGLDIKPCNNRAKGEMLPPKPEK